MHAIKVNGEPRYLLSEAFIISRGIIFWFNIDKKKRGNVEYGKFHVTAISDCFWILKTYDRTIRTLNI